MNKKKIAGLIALGVVGYEANQYFQMTRALSYTIRNFKVSKGKGFLILSYDVVATNTSNTSLPITSIGGTVYYGKSGIATFNTNGSVNLKAGQTTNIKLVSHISVSEGLNALYEAMQKTTKFDINYRVTAMPRFLGFVPVPVVYKEKLSYDLAPYLEMIKQLGNAIKSLKK